VALPFVARNILAQAVRDSDALEKPWERDKARLDKISGAVGVPASSRYTPPPSQVYSPTDRSLYRSEKWAEEKAIEDMPLWARTLTTGPVGGFLNAIQKPLALTTSAMKEGIDLFTGQEASWDDFKRQVGDNYTFGRLLHDYDLLQGEGWQKWAARGIGFTGDVIFDPLNLLKPVNAAAKLGLQVAKRGTRPIAGELARTAVLRSVRGQGDDVLRGVSKAADDIAERGITWETIADDIAYLGKEGAGAKGKLVGSWTRNAADDGWDLATRTALEGGDEIAAKVSDDVVDEITKVIDIGTDVQKGTRGPTALSAGNLRTVAKAMAKTNMDSSFRVGADPFADVLGAGARLPAGVQRVMFKEVDGELVETALGEVGEAGFRGADGRIVRNVDEAASAHRGSFLNAAEAENIKYEWGVSLPFTGAVGRALRVADPIERLSQKFIRSGAQYPVGLRLITTETPYLGRMVTGIPQGLRRGVAKVGGTRFGTTLLKSAGRLGDLKADIRDSTDAVFRQRGKRVLHAVARGDSVTKGVRVTLMKKAAPFLSDVKEVGADVSDVYYALGGDAEALENLARVERAAGREVGSIVEQGRRTLNEMHAIANEAGGRPWLGEVDNYVPRQLTDDMRELLFNPKTGAASHKHSPRVHRKRGKHSPTTDQSRKYVATDSEEWSKAVAERAAADGISEDAAAIAIRKEGRLSDEFWGETLRSTDEAGNSLSIEKQIADQLERSGADASLFADDIDLAIQGWIRQVSGRTGEVYAETVLMQEGILIDRLAEYNFLPSTEAVKAAGTFHKAQERLANAASQLDDVLRRRQAEVPEHDLDALDAVVKEREAIYDQAKQALDAANAEQEAVWNKLSRAEELYTDNLREIEQINSQIRQIEEQVALFDEGTTIAQKAIRLENERLALVARRDALYANNPKVAQSAYNRLGSATSSRLYIEEGIRGVMGSAETFRAFLREYGSLDMNNLGEGLAGTNGRWVAPDGTEFDVERTLQKLDHILGESDESGIGVWLGVEAQLAADLPKKNPATKLDFALQRIDQESREALAYLNKFDEVVEQDGLTNWTPPTADEVVEAKRVIVEILEDSHQQDLGTPYGWEHHIEATPGEMYRMDSDLGWALRTYYAGHDLPVPAFVADGQDLDSLIKQVDENIGGQIGNVEQQLDELGNIADAEGMPIRLNVDFHGRQFTMGVKDFVYLKQLQNDLKPVLHGGQMPVPVKRVSVDEILDQGTQISGPLGTNDGGIWELNGERFYLKNYSAADGPGMIPGSERVAGEVLANALYRELGLGAPDSYASQALDGSVYHVSPWMDDMRTVQDLVVTGAAPENAVLWTDQFGRIRATGPDEVPVGVPTSSVAQQVFRGYMADVLLANWDVTGMGADNIAVRNGVSTYSSFNRVDNGGVFNSRAQGRPKTTRDPNWTPDSVSEFDSLRNPEISPEYARLMDQAESEVSNVSGLVGQQLQELLDLRAGYGGMEGFARRFMPGMSDEELAPFVDFLERRLQVLAETWNKNFFEAGSDDLQRQAMAARGWSPDRIDAAMAAGGDQELLLNHVGIEDDFLNLIQRPNSNIFSDGWGDYDFVNTVPAPYSYTGKDPTHRIVLQTPQGPANIKIYGLDLNASEVAEAQKILNLQRNTDPLQIDDASGLFDENNFLNNKNVGPLVEIRMDIFNRVSQSEPEFFNDFVQSLKQARRDVGASNEQVNAAIDSIEFAWTSSKLDVSNLFGADQVALQHFQQMDFRDKIRFLSWRRKYKRTTFLELNSSFVDDLNRYHSLGDPNFKNSQEIAVFKSEVQSAELELMNSFMESPQFRESLEVTALDPASRTGGRLKKTGETKGTPEFWHLQPTMATGMPPWERMVRIYQRSLSADGYTATAWFNHMDNIGPDTDTFPNVLLSNPMAAVAETVPEALDQVDAFNPQEVIDLIERNILTELTPTQGARREAADALEVLYAAREALIFDTPALLKELDRTRAEWNAALAVNERVVQGEAFADAELVHAALARQALNERQVVATEARNLLENLEAVGDLAEYGPESLRAVQDADLDGDLVTTLKVLLESGDQELRLALAEFRDGTEDWFRLLGDRPNMGENFTKPLSQWKDIETTLNDVFVSSWKPIGNTLQGPENIVEAMTASERWVARGGAAGFLKQYDKVHNWLRAYMIAKPGFHGRNFFSGAFMNHLAGMNASSYKRFTAAYWKFREEEAVRLGLPDTASKIRKAMRAKGLQNVKPEHVQYVRELDRAGALGSASGQIASEFVEGDIRVAGRRIPGLNRLNPFRTDNIVLSKSAQLGMGTETLLRGALGFDTMIKGGTAGEGFDQIMKFHFDYSDLSDFESNVVKRLVPFYTWTRKNIPLMLEMSMRRPEVFNRVNSFKKEMEQGLEKPEEVPEWMVRQGAIQMPFKYKGESMFITPDLPFKSPLEMFDPTLKFDKDMPFDRRIDMAISTIGSQMTPLIKAPYERITKRNLWKGYNFGERYDEVPRAYTMIPGMMPLLSIGGIAEKDSNDKWHMKAYNLHAMAQMLPTLMDIRRLYPDEDRYKERLLSNWISWTFGAGLRTNTKWEQEQSRISREYERRAEEQELRELGR